jgi:uncharacterized SAM-binding protein YcdF (DUF218 family)
MYQLVVGLLDPYRLLLVIITAAIVLLWRKRAGACRSLIFLTLAFAALVILNLPVVGYFALGSLEWQYPPAGPRASDADAIVVLSGSVMPPDRFRRHTELGTTTLQRCVRAAELYHEGKALPVLVAGGKPGPEIPGDSAALAMHDFLVSMGVSQTDLIMESSSRSSHENAIESFKILSRRGMRKIILVTDAVHLRRAVSCFENRGIEIVPAGCHYRATEIEYRLSDFPPSPDAASCCLVAFHEWMGVVYYRMRGWI